MRAKQAFLLHWSINVEPKLNNQKCLFTQRKRLQQFIHTGIVVLDTSNMVKAQLQYNLNYSNCSMNLLEMVNLQDLLDFSLKKIHILPIPSVAFDCLEMVLP